MVERGDARLQTLRARGAVLVQLQLVAPRPLATTDSVPETVWGNFFLCLSLRAMLQGCVALQGRVPYLGFSICALESWTR